MRARILTLVAVAAVGFAGTGRAQRNGMFDGIWTLNVPASTASASLPSSARYVIRTLGDTLTIARATVQGQDTVRNTISVGMDGNPRSNHVILSAQGLSADLLFTVKWDGPVLVLNGTGMIEDTELSQSERWTLSSDGSTITSDRAISANGQQVNTARFVFNKVTPGSLP